MKSRYGLEIRAATEAEAPGLSQLLAAAGLDIPPRLLADRLEAVRQGPGTALIAIEWGPPSGVVVLHWYRALEADQPVAQITTLLVGPDDRRRGIGRMLIKAAAQAARVAGCAALTVAVPEDALSLRQFCVATGFIGSGQSFVRPLRKKT